MRRFFVALLLVLGLSSCGVLWPNEDQQIERGELSDTYAEYEYENHP